MNDEGDFDQVCVCCNAFPDLIWDGFGPEDLVRVCTECKEDGSFLKWLEDDLSAAAKSMGWTLGVDPVTKEEIWIFPD